MEDNISTGTKLFRSRIEILTLLIHCQAMHIFFIYVYVLKVESFITIVGKTL